MAKLSNLFGRRGGETVTDRPAPRLGPGRGNGNGEHRTIESLSDLGSRMGEENEVLRNLLTDTGRKIGELDELKEAFDKIVAPFNSTLRALEQEKSQTLGLTGMLNESRAAYETLRTEFYQIEKKATALEAEAEKLRIDLELARESNRSLESTRLELSNEISTRYAQITDLEHQLAHETSQRRTLSENRQTLEEQLDGAEKRNMELEGELAAAREKLALLEDEKRSLQIAVDQAFNETARLTRRLTESENTLTATRAQLGKVETSFAEAYAERGRLRRRARRDPRAAPGRTQQPEHAARCVAVARRHRRAAAVRGAAESDRPHRGSARLRPQVGGSDHRPQQRGKRLAQIEAMHEARERQVKDLEQARAALTERNNAVTKTLKAREAALARAEEKISALTERNGHLEADVQVSRTNIEKRVEELNSALQRERMERAVVEGALEAARKDNSRLQSEVAALRSSLRRGVALDDVQLAPSEAANDEALANGKKGKSAGTA